MGAFDWDAPVYDDVAAEAYHDWLSERPPRIRAEDVLDGDELADYYDHQPARTFRRPRLLPDPWEGTP